MSDLVYLVNRRKSEHPKRISNVERAGMLGFVVGVMMTLTIVLIVGVL